MHATTHRSRPAHGLLLLLALTATACAGDDAGDDGGTDATSGGSTTGTSADTATTAPETTTTTTTTTTTESTTSEATTSASTTETGSTGAASVTDTEGRPVCGDGVVEGIELCDDGNLDNGDACLDTCQPAACGDGFVHAGVEACDDGNADNSDGCLTTCAVNSCGDGFVAVGVELCDDGNLDNNDGCLDTCQPASCGDGYLQAGVETCDDGNQIDDDECTNGCAAASCGDGIVQPALGEACDDGNDDNSDDCLDTCQPASCGDGYLHAGVEACDDGGMNNDNTGPCKSDCSICPCQGDDVMGMTCADFKGFSCGVLACAGCEYDTSECADPTPPEFAGEVGPDFSGDGCWSQCEGYFDAKESEDIPKAWGANCMGAEFDRLRVACGTGVDSYRYITVEKNVFRDLLAGYPENGLISESKDQDGVDFSTSNQIYAENNDPNSGRSWWGNGNGCGENNTNMTVNNVCTYEVANCFGQGISGDRYLWVYVAP